MNLKVRRISVRFALLLAAAAVVPLLAYGFISLMSLERGTRQTVIQGNLNVATRAAEEIRRYVTTNADLLKALSADLQDTGLSQPQQDRILKNYVLQVREFREITLFDESGKTIATSRVGKPRVQIPTIEEQIVNGVKMSPIRVDEDLLPTTTFALQLMRLGQPSGWLVGEFSLEEMWRMVDRIRIGNSGYAMVVAPDGELIAHGDPDKKALVAQATNMSSYPLVAASRASRSDTPVSLEYVDSDSRSNLGVAARIPALGWTVIVEQPTSEAYATASELRRQLMASISIALLGMIVVGYFFGRSFIRPILKLKSGTQGVAAGKLDTRVDIRSADEFGELGDAFNTMADRLVELQENVKRQERQAMFGRIAAGLVHDLSHPIQNIGNSARLIARDDVPVETRETFRNTVDKELQTIKRFLDDLRNIAKPRPVERFSMDANGSVAEIVDSMRAEGERNGIKIDAHYAPEPLVIHGDRFALGRVYRNLITNAIQATAEGGKVTIATARAGDHAEISVTDTGSGIPPERLSAIFDDFITTKRHGLGLGLAISKRIVEQLDGTIAVASEVGRGTSFTLRFPIRDDRTAEAAAS
ncbi:MAG TPA: sensor histidine kinase [Vicinamibacterales bacterium]|jgi:signal transduction histidine kinase